MSRRFVIQIEARFHERLDEALRQRVEALGIGVFGYHAAERAVVVEGHLRLSTGEHQLDAHHGIKRALGAAQLATRWIDLDEAAWAEEIRDAAT